MSDSNCAVIVDNRLTDSELSNIVDAHLAFLHGWSCVSHRTEWIKTPHDYNTFLTSEQFWNPLQQFERVLIFQHDTKILRKGIDEFLEWDYVGAPWKHDAPWARGDRKGGNGGLSLRCPKKALSLIRNTPYRHWFGNEDVYFTHHLEQVDGKIAPFEICNKFSCETVFQLGTFGCHAIDKHLTDQQVNLILNQYVES